MTFAELLVHYAGLTKAAKALELPITTVSGWRSGIPYGRQCQIQIITGGALRADEQRKRGKRNGR